LGEGESESSFKDVGNPSHYYRAVKKKRRKQGQGSHGDSLDYGGKDAFLLIVRKGIRGGRSADDAHDLGCEVSTSTFKSKGGEGRLRKENDASILGLERRSVTT